MKLSVYLALVALCFLAACKNNGAETALLPEEVPKEALPFTVLDLEDLSAFKSTGANWQLVGNVNADLSQEKTFTSQAGTGILLNNPEKDIKDHLFTAFEHGDIEIELDVMMPINSNSGLYFQGRYEIQLLDSWGKEQPEHSDIGGIYQRWDNTREEKGYEGRPPKLNAAKSPGLWQHFKIKFQAPKFDASGNKTKNALFQEVWLNGALIHKDQEVTGSTRAAAFKDERPLGPLMIQGDHGPVALRNIKYKLYGDQKVSLQDLKMKEFKNTQQTIPKLDTLELEREITADSISSLMTMGDNPQKILYYKGKMAIPTSGEYLFTMKTHGGALLLVNKDTVTNLNGDYSPNTADFGSIHLEQGEIPFTLTYNKHRGNRRGLELFVEGPGIAKHPLHSAGSAPENNDDRPNITLSPAIEETVLQRGFVMHEGIKRTHCISVASPQGIHYTFDLAMGSLLQAWSGEFLDVTKMWRGRGGEQLETPMGLPIIVHGDPDFAFLENETSVWPDSIPPATAYRQLGYGLDTTGNPEFSTQLGASVVSNKFVASDSARKLQRVITVDTDTEIWHKIGEGIIESPSENRYTLNDKQYFVDFSENPQFKPVIRTSEGTQELVLRIPEGQQKITYTLIW